MIHKFWLHETSLEPIQSSQKCTWSYKSGHNKGTMQHDGIWPNLCVEPGVNTYVIYIYIYIIYHFIYPSQSMCKIGNCWYSQYVKLLGSFEGEYLKFAMCNKAYLDVLIVWNRARHCGQGLGIKKKKKNYGLRRRPEWIKCLFVEHPRPCLH